MSIIDETIDFVKENIQNKEFIDFHKNLQFGWGDVDLKLYLYYLAKKVDGPILEIGCFTGNSTCWICKGIKDGKKGKEFDTLDCFPNNVEEWYRYYGYIHTKIEEKIIGVILKKGLLKALENQLDKNNFKNYVNIINGFFLDINFSKKYKFIYSDITDISQLYFERMRDIIVDDGIIVRTYLGEEDKLNMLNHINFSEYKIIHVHRGVNSPIKKSEDCFVFIGQVKNK